ncbi:MAG: amidase [SAR324 cluster bacterium]|nr:amidase [SAR324 cluster bacterium]
MELSPLYWPISKLIDAYQKRSISPVEVLNEAMARIDRYDGKVNAYLERFEQPALKQAQKAEDDYRSGHASVLSGIPVSIKDTFEIKGAVTTYGSRVYKTHIPDFDCGTVRRLRAAGAVFTGKTNNAEFGQSACSQNRLGRDTGNPWDLSRTPGGSSGGAAASVAAGLANVALGADGGGSVRIPAAFNGLVGIKPGYGLCRNENGLRAMSDFISPGPLSWCVEDGRVLLGVLAEKQYSYTRIRESLKIAWCPTMENRPVEPGVSSAIELARQALRSLGHQTTETEAPVAGWNDAFAPLVLAEEHRERGHLLEKARDELSDYVRISLEAGCHVSNESVKNARQIQLRYRQTINDFLENYDVIATPATAVPAFPLGIRPSEINGHKVSRLWGAFPFTAPFNVSGHPAIVIPCGLSDGLPVGLQLVGKWEDEERLLNLAQDLEMEISFDRGFIINAWSGPSRD